MDKIIGPVTANIIDSLTHEISKKKNRKKIIQRVITPILEDINKKYYPHFMALLSLLIIMTIMMIGLTIIVYTSKTQTNPINNQ
jgi:hypothetical protein